MGTEHVVNPDMPWNEKIRATWVTSRPRASLADPPKLMVPLNTVSAAMFKGPSAYHPVLHHSDDPDRPTRLWA